jgi:hypothetical protein
VALLIPAIASLLSVVAILAVLPAALRAGLVDPLIALRTD